MKKLLLTLLALCGLNVAAQVKIGDNPTNIGSSSLLELESSNKAFVLTRVVNTAAIITPLNGMMVYDISTNCIKVYENGKWSNCITAGGMDTTNSVTANCDANGLNGSFINGVVLSGASFSVTITNNSLSTSTIPVLASDVVLTGISGLTVGTPTSTAISNGTATIRAGQNALITYPITGTPAATGTLTATWNKLSLSCTKTKAVFNASTNGNAIIAAVTCNTASAGTLTTGIPVLGVTQTITVNVTQIGTYSIGTGAVNGVTFTASGNFTATGSQEVVLTATGTPVITGMNTYNLNIAPGCSFTRYAGTTATVTDSNGFVYNPVTAANGTIWLNNNLGADYANPGKAAFNPAQQATSSKDYLAYGSLVQWGRKLDGHELINWTSDAQGTPVNGTTTAKSDNPTNALYIIGGADWRVTQNDNLWNGVNAANNPCPAGYRVPSITEVTALNLGNISNAYSTPMKYTRPALRRGTDGNLTSNIGVVLDMWTSTPGNGDYAQSVSIHPDSANNTSGSLFTRSFGMTIRCIKN